MTVPLTQARAKTREPRYHPQVSVAIDNYNYARFLDDSISSALNQTYPNTKVVVVDDAADKEDLR